MSELKLKKSDIPDGSAKVIAVTEQLNIAVFRAGDRVAAIDNRCPHAGGSLGEGPFDGTLVKCPLHAFRVNVWSGIGNAGKRVRTFPVNVVGEDVSISLA
jgi:nitrite reductase/ring-hydroxylating ferredoxin subunit